MSMRIFIPGASFEDSFVDNVATTLRALNIEVETLGDFSAAAYWALPAYAWRVAKTMLAGDRQSAIERKIVRRAKAFRPDMILALTQGYHQETMAAFSALCPGRVVLWWGDPPANSQRWGLVDPRWDAIFIKDEYAVRKLRLIGREAHLLHEAMNPVWHRPVDGQSSGKVAVVGNYYAFRQALILRMLDNGVDMALYGSRPPQWSDERILRHHSGRYVTRLEKSDVFHSSLACLNTFQLAETASLNCRAFEIAGAGGLQLIENRAAIRECFEPGREVLTFNTFEELVELIAQIRKAPAHFASIRVAAARRALAEHTYAHRLRAIFDIVR
jgi:spore maturation protein CgeB